MKTLQLYQEYARMSRLCPQDKSLFRKLLSRKENVAYSYGFDDLYIMPVDIHSTFVCHNCLIEHHQLFRSKTSHRWYLVFCPVKRAGIYKPYSAVYEFIYTSKQPDYIYLHRLKRGFTSEHVYGGMITTVK